MVDSEPVWFHSETEFVRARGAIWTHQEAAHCVGRGLPWTVRHMASVAGVTCNLERDLDELVDLFIAQVESIPMKAGCAELLAAAEHRLPMTVGSSSPRRVVSSVLSGLGLTDRFVGIVSGDDVENLKPSPDIFLAAAALLDVAPAHCLVLEDSPAGATAAHRAGIPVIAVPEGNPAGRGFEEVADAIVADLHAALSLIDLS